MAGNKNSGRKKGIPNRRTQEITEKLEELGCDPIAGLARVAQQAMDEGDLSIASGAYKELAQYIAPKRKAIEVDSNISITAELGEKTTDEIKKELDELGF